MRNAAAAEWILRLVTDPARAAATVGDLLEEDRGALRFWSSVLRTAASHIVHDIWHHPLAMLRVALAVFLEVAVAAALLTFIFNLIVPALIEAAPYSWGYLLLILAARCIVYFLCGWEAVRQAQGREIAGAITVFALLVAFPEIYSAPRWSNHLPTLCYWIAVILCRRRAHRSLQPAR